MILRLNISCFVLVTFITFVILSASDIFIFNLRDLSHPLKTALIHQRKHFPGGAQGGSSISGRDGSLLQEGFVWESIKKEDILGYFSQIEIDSIPRSPQDTGVCNSNEIAQACCVGTISRGGGNQRMKACYSNISLADIFFEQQFPVPYFKKFSLPNVERLYNMGDIVKLNAEIEIFFLGDSVMNQNFDNMICDTQRYTNSGVKIDYYRRKRVKWNIGTSWRIVAQFDDFNKTNFVFHREFTFHESGITIKEACSSANVLVLNFGLHWNSFEEYRKSILLLGELLKSHCKGVKLVFRGSTSQHFPTPHGLFDAHFDTIHDYANKTLSKKFVESIENNTVSKLFYAGCRPIFDVDFVGRDDVARESLLGAGFEVHDALEMDEEHWKQYRSLKEDSILFIPFERITRNLYDFHFKECSHYCNSPYVWSIVYHFLFKAIHDDIDVNKKPSIFVPKPWRTKKYKNNPDFQIEGLANSTVYSGNKPSVL